MTVDTHHSSNGHVSQTTTVPVTVQVGPPATTTTHTTSQGTHFTDTHVATAHGSTVDIRETTAGPSHKTESDVTKASTYTRSGNHYRKEVVPTSNGGNTIITIDTHKDQDGKESFCVTVPDSSPISTSSFTPTQISKQLVPNSVPITKTKVTTKTLPNHEIQTTDFIPVTSGIETIKHTVEKTTNGSITHVITKTPGGTSHTHTQSTHTTTDSTGETTSHEKVTDNCGTTETIVSYHPVETDGLTVTRDVTHTPHGTSTDVRQTITESDGVTVTHDIVTDSSGHTYTTMTTPTTIHPTERTLSSTSHTTKHGGVVTTNYVQTSDGTVVAETSTVARTSNGGWITHHESPTTTSETGTHTWTSAHVTTPSGKTFTHVDETSSNGGQVTERIHDSYTPNGINTF